MLKQGKSNIVRGHSNVFQRLRYLENKFGNEHEFYQNLQFKASLSLSFPNGDFSVADGSDKQFSMHFMALVGVDGCLPNYFNDLLCSSEQKKRLQDFLDIFHHHIYLLAYKAWKGQRPDILLEFGNQKWLSILQNIMPSLNINSDLMSFSPQFLCNKKTPFSLANLVNKLFHGYSYTIFSVQGNWHVHGLENILGNKQLCLGENTFIGERFLKRSQTVHIKFESLSQDAFEKLNKNKKQLMDILSRYVDIFHTISLSAEVNYGPPSLVLGKDLIKVGSSLCLTNYSYQLVFKL